MIYIVVCVVFVVLCSSVSLPFPFLFSARVAPVESSAGRSGGVQMSEDFDMVAVSVVLISLRVRDFQSA